MPAAPDDQVVVHRHAKRSGCFDDVLCHRDVRLRGRRVARRMVMYEDQSGGLELKRSFDDLPSVDRRMIDGAALLALMFDERVLTVEKEDVKFLDFAVSDLRV